MKSNLVVFFVGLIGFLLSGCTSHDNNGVISSYIRIAQKAHASGNSDAATNFYNKIIEMNSEDYRAYLGLSEIYIDSKLLDLAIQYIKKAEDRGAPANRVAYLRGKIFLLQEDVTAAEREFKKYEATYSLNALGAIYDNRGDHKKAQALYKRVISIDPKYIDAYNNLGLSLLLCGHYKEAVFYLKNACALPGANAMYRSNLALALGLYGNLSEARGVYAQDYSGEELEEKMAYLEDMIASKND